MIIRHGGICRATAELMPNLRARLICRCQSQNRENQCHCAGHYGADHNAVVRKEHSVRHGHVFLPTYKKFVGEGTMKSDWRFERYISRKALVSRRERAEFVRIGDSKDRTDGL